MSLYKIKTVIDNWSECRQRTVASLRRSASILRSSHRENAAAEHDSATASLMGDFVGLGGVILAPFSGGLSLAFCGVSAATGIGSYFNKREANQKNDRIKKEVDDDVQRAVEEDRRASAKLNEIFTSLTNLEQQLQIMKIDDILISVQEISITTLDINVREIEGGCLKSQLQQGSTSLSIPGLGISTQVANLNAALTSAEEVVKITRVSKQVFCGSKTIKEIVSTAKSVNQISKAANSLSTARQAASLSIQASQTMARSTSAFASVARGTDGVVKTVGVVSSATKSAKLSAQVITASGRQAASAAQSVTKAVKAGTAISRATKGADTTIKTVKNIKQASNTVKTVTQVATDTEKAVRTTRITTNAARVTRVTETATKAASISKVGLAINAVVIPLDIYNLVVASDNLNKSHEDVQRIEDQANALEQEMNITKGVNVQIESFSELHVQLCKVYENHRIVVIYDYLEKMHEQLGFTIPFRY